MGQAGKDLDDLFRGLSLGENGLVKATAQLTVMIKPGKADVFIGQVTQLVYCTVYVNGAGFDLLEELFYLFFANKGTFYL